MKALLEDPTFVKQKLDDQYFHEDNVFKDARDGLNFRNNAYFLENPNAVPLMIFQDELEVANPLGSGRTKHKINCTYYSTFEVQSSLRSKTRSIQLISLVSSKLWKKYGNLATNKHLLDDLKRLEEEGIMVRKPFQRIVKAGLCVIVGDN